MFARLLTPIVVSLSLVSTVAAQNASYLPSNEPNADRLMADRVKFIRDNYQLDHANTEKIVKDMMALQPFQDKYLKDAAKTIYRIEMAITIVYSSNDTPEADKPAKIARLESELAGIYSKAPLSIANTMKMVDGAITPQAAETAHAKIASKFASQLRGAPMTPEKLDALLIPPVKPVKPPVISAAQPESPKPPVVTSTPPAQQTNPTPATPANQPMPNQAMPASMTNILPPPPAAPPRVIAPAPAIDEWNAALEKAASKYNFTPEQRKVADRALLQCKTRAQTARSEKKSELDEAAKISDEKARATKMTELNKPVDTVYDELVQRMDALATMEQKDKAQKNTTPTGK